MQNILMTLLLEAFFFIRKEYSKLCKRKYREFKQDLISKIYSLHQNDSKQYWEILNSLRNDNQDSTYSKITPEEWVSHFSNLNKTKQEYTNRVEVITFTYFTIFLSYKKKCL
jgi:predicted RNA-binding protein with EMAP domain